MKYLILLIGALTLTACGGGDSDSGFELDESNFQKVVEFSIDPVTGASCPNSDDITTFTSSDYTSVDCVWTCATYNGQFDRYVSLSAEKSDRTDQLWVFGNEYVSGGICP